MAASDHTSKVQFHASSTPLGEFMRAPALHVGTKGAAKARTRDRSIMSPNEYRKGFKTHALAFSQHAEFHPETLNDEEANEAHARFLEQRGITPSLSVRDSRASSSIDLPKDSEERVGRAVDALSQNKIVPYVNQAEDVGSISHLVPSPHMNMRTRGKPDPLTQPTLPMDYSGINPSDRTEKDRFWWG